MHKVFWSLLLVSLVPLQLLGQQETDRTISGHVIYLDAEGKEEPLVGANVYWLNGNQGVVTDVHGSFSISRHPDYKSLVCSYVGFLADTIKGVESGVLKIELIPESLEEVRVVHRKKSTEISLFETLKVEQIGEKELLKAACCNLSESFETNPSVDVSYTDAVTGVRQIQMLGLASPYTVIERENMPDVRGLAAIYGTTFTPGTWVEGMQLVKGTGSVANGYEAVAGQINVELRKPMTSERLYINLYTNEGQRREGNVHFAHRFDEQWSTGLLLHGADQAGRHDRNDDGFMDLPIGQQFVGLNRWHYIGEDGLRMQAGIKATLVDRTGGEKIYGLQPPSSSRLAWGMDLAIDRYEAWLKLGKVYEDIPWRSFGLQMSVLDHDQNSQFGLLSYQAKQKAFFGKFLYNSIIGNTNHKFLAGLSFKYDRYDEQLSDVNYLRDEVVPGAFFEYSYNLFEELIIIAGIRADHHNLIGFFLTPRMHMRYSLSENNALRFTMGKGLRTANIFAENHGIFSSSREIVIEADPNEANAYGLEPEVAWNFGVNFTQKFSVQQRTGSISFDFYHTYFQNQVVLDLDYNTQQALFYNLQGESYSNSFQAQLDYEIATRLDVRMAYRWYDVKTDFRTGRLQSPLIAEHRGFLNLAYETSNTWKFDLTLNYQGSRRIPSTETNPEAYRLPGRSPAYLVTNAQISRGFGEKWEFYSGVENLWNYRQENAILSSDDPFGPYFDSYLIWGPIFGRKLYLGMRYRLEY